MTWLALASCCVAALLMGAALGLALAQYLTRDVPKPEPETRNLPDALMVRACALVTAAERLQASGEFKRHQVYARLIKDFPETPKRELSRAIEDAVRECC